MSNDPATTENTDLGQHMAHSACKIAPYGELSDVCIDCWLVQNGNVVTQFYDHTIGGTFKANVCLTGDLRHHICGELCLCVHIECVGPGDPTVLPCVRVPLEPCRGLGEDKTCYDLEVYIPPNHLSAGECGSFCCFVATVTSFLPHPCNDVRGHICCYCKGPCVMVCPPPEHSRPIQ